MIRAAAVRLGCGLALAWVSLFGASAWAARDVGPQRECATCHIMWINDFKRDDVVTLIPYEPKPVTETGRQDVSSTERMCFSCHDGFMLDSRANWRDKTHSHPVGVKPSNKVQVPTAGGKTIFPLNDDGKVYCGTCHTAHGVDWDQTQSPVFMRAKNVDSSLCLACHLDQGTGPREGNHPLFEPIESPPAEITAVGGKFGRGQSVICQSCHAAHGASAKKMLVATNTDSKLCATCHASKREILNSKHDMAVMAPQARNRKGETAAQSGPCGVCHVPHQGGGPALWARERPPQGDPTAVACLACHNEDGLAKKKVLTNHNHPINVSVSDIGITAREKCWTSQSPELEKGAPLVPLQLYSKEGLRRKGGTQVGCGSCHDPHRWTSEPQTTTVAADPRKLEGGPRDSFLRLPLDANSRLCINCHVDKRAIAASKHNMVVASAPAAAPAQTGPASQSAPKPEAKAKGDAEGVCQACHQPHNAKRELLWARSTGAGKGASEVLCNDCHRKGGAAEKKLPGPHSHPLNKPLKLGMDPKLPLFAATDKPQAKSNVDCATCHDPHVWDPVHPALRAGAEPRVEGDGRTSFLRKAAAPNGDLCVECHTDQKLVRGTDHDLNVTAPTAKNARGETVKQSGVCGQCHAAHNAPQERKLWVQAPGQAADPMEKYCRSCHAPGRVAAGKVPAQTKHPATVQLWASGVRARFLPASMSDLPVFQGDSASDSRGVINCATCHNVHQWTPGKEVDGPGKPVEGDIRNSFLRAANSEHIVCADCHGLDALYRYKYFHGQSTHRKYPLYR